MLGAYNLTTNGNKPELLERLESFAKDRDSWVSSVLTCGTAP